MCNKAAVLMLWQHTATPPPHCEIGDSDGYIPTLDGIAEMFYVSEQYAAECWWATLGTWNMLHHRKIPYQIKERKVEE